MTIHKTEQSTLQVIWMSYKVWSHTWLSFNHGVKLILNERYVSQSLISVGRPFHVWAALTETADCPKAVLLIGSIQSPLATDLVCLSSVVFMLRIFQITWFFRIFHRNSLSGLTNTSNQPSENTYGKIWLVCSLCLCLTFTAGQRMVPLSFILAL